MSTPVERGRHEDVDDVKGQDRGHDPGADGQDVAVIVTPGQAGGVFVVAQSRPGPKDLVGRQRLPLAAASEHDAEISATLDHVPGGAGTDRGVVDRLLGEGAEVGHVVTPSPQVLGDDPLEGEPSVVTGDDDPHRRQREMGVPAGRVRRRRPRTGADLRGPA